MAHQVIISLVERLSSKCHSCSLRFGSWQAVNFWDNLSTSGLNSAKDKLAEDDDDDDD